MLRDPRDILGKRRRHHVGKLENLKDFTNQVRNPKFYTPSLNSFHNLYFEKHER